MPKKKKIKENKRPLPMGNTDSKSVDNSEDKVSPVELPPTMTVGELSSKR